MYLLDTNTVSDLIRNPQGTIAKHISRVGEANVVTSIIVAAELRFGVARKGSLRLARQMDAVLRLLPVLALAADADIHYGTVRSDLERRGMIIGGNDMFMAAHALALGAVIVTDNVREFERIAGLSVENWLRLA